MLDNNMAPTMDPAAAAAAMAGGFSPDAGTGQVIQREVKEISPERRQLVTDWAERVKAGKTHWGPTFRAMRANQKFVRGKQWPGAIGGTGEEEDDRYVANITLRHINQRTSQLYAKNPTVVAKRQPRMDFAVWDGTEESLKAAVAANTAPPMMDGTPADPQAAEIIKDVAEGRARQVMAKKVGKTLEILMKHFFEDPTVRFKKQFKQLIRRVDTCAAGYTKLGYQRIHKLDPDITGKIADATAQIERLETLAHDMADGEIFEGQAEIDQLKTTMKLLQEKESILVREGLTFSFPRAWSIILDPDTKMLAGFIGSGWVAEEYVLTTDQIKDIFKVDVGTACSNYNRTGENRAGAGTGGGADSKKKYCLVYEIYDLVLQTRYWYCEGYEDFLDEPDGGDVELAQFHPYFPLTFNDIEDEENIFPPSEVSLVRHQQLEYNRAREGLRQHRIANKPAIIGLKGLLDKEDKNKMADHAINEFIELAIAQGTKIGDILQAKPTVPIDPAVYETDHVFQDLQRVSNSQAADLGGTSGATATESTIAESSRNTSMGSTVDDIDEYLTDIVRASGEILLRNVSTQYAKRVAGPGACWPELSRQDYLDQLYLDIRAGSSGRPNHVLKAQNIERMLPLAMQLPGTNPAYLRTRLFTELDEDYDEEEAILDGLPSVQALNAMAASPQAPPGAAPPQANGAGQPPGSDPGAQGPAGAAGGGSNAPTPAPAHMGGSGQMMQVHQPQAPAAA